MVLIYFDGFDIPMVLIYFNGFYIFQ